MTKTQETGAASDETAETAEAPESAEQSEQAETTVETTESEPERDGVAPPAPRPGRPTLWVLGLAAIALLGAEFYVLGLTDTAEGLDEWDIVEIASSLFVPVTTAAFAGGVLGLVAPRLFKKVPQKAAAVLGFSLIALAAGAGAYLIYRVDTGFALAVALILFASAVLGGLFALPRHALPVAAGLWGALLLLGLTLARNIPQVSSIEESNELFGYLVPFVLGVVCGMVAFAYLRGRKGGTKLMGYLFAGAIPGAIWLVSIIAAQIGIETLVTVSDADALPELAEAFLSPSFETQYNESITAMFAGAFCAVLAFGLLLSKPGKPEKKAKEPEAAKKA